MKRLSGLDAVFLSGETDTMHNHVMGVFIFDPSTVEGGYSFQKIKELVRNRLPLLPPFRRRAMQVPFGLHHPIWIEDPDFDLNYHIRRASLPKPGSMKELAELASEIIERPLDLSKPLWEMYVVEGLEDGMIAQITKTHHAAIDGVSGAELAAQFLDITREPRVITPEDPPWRPDRIPSDFELVAYAMTFLVKHPRNIVRFGLDFYSAAREVAERNAQRLYKPPPSPFRAPKTRINGALSPHRKVAFAEISLDDVKLVKNVFGGKVNDVVMTICGTALRAYLMIHKDLPEQPLVAMVPISVRTEDEKGSLGNKVSMMLVSLETDIEDPVKRLELIAKNSEVAKEQEKAIGAKVLTNWSEFAAPAVFARAARLISNTKVFNRLNPAFNVTISNVPGPNFPLYGAGARMVAMYPLGPLVEGVGLNITVMSYMGSMFFGLQACPELIPDVGLIASLIQDCAVDMVKAAERTQRGLEPRARSMPRKRRPGEKSARLAKPPRGEK